MKASIKVTSEDVQELFFYQVKLRHKAIEVCNNIFKEVLKENKEFNPDTDKVEFILDKTYELDEDGEIEVFEFDIPSVVIKQYSEEEKTFKITMDFPVTWLKDEVDHVAVAKEMHELEALLDDRFEEYQSRFEEQVRREEVTLNLKGDPDPIINAEFHKDKYIEISDKIDKEISKISKYADLPPSNFTDGLKEFIKNIKKLDDFEEE